MSASESTTYGLSAYRCEIFLQRIHCLTFEQVVVLLIMSSTQKTDTVSFTVKGQVVIPSWLRKDFEINEGTRAVVYKQDDHIVLKPLTAAAISGARGLLKKKPGEKPLRQWWAEYKKEEKALEEARYARLRPR